ncbi:DUF4127 family protein [Streptomyces sp. PU-14G]|uniref:DUF4127 family protein n=1 Tax=Streptomyces sp. PU-14G TaxID=2800808 RepID=UPI0034DF6437
MHIALLPLDERPVNTRLPQLVGALAGAHVHLPPSRDLSRKRRPAATGALTRWLESAVDAPAPLDALVVSLDMLGYGGLIASRTTKEPTAAVLERWEVLRHVREVSPQSAVHAVSLVTRAPNSYNCDEEPDYWSDIGADLHRYGAALHRAYLGEPEGDHETVDAFRGRLPTAQVADLSARRLRNHTVNLAALSLAADGILDTLLVTADDTAQRSAGSLEQQWLAHWQQTLSAAAPRVLMHPGADEVGAVLVARAVLTKLRPEALPVAVVCGVEHGLQRVAPYENLPIGQGARGHVDAVGGRQVPPAEAELVVVVHPPDPAGGDWAHRHPRVRDPEDTEVRATAETVSGHVRDGHAVVVADCAYPNGSDPALVSALARRMPLTALAGYAGWNTAGNTMGSALAHGAVYTAARERGVADTTAHHRLLLHRLVEDCAYMSDIRGAALAQFTDQVRHSTLPDGKVATVRAWIAEQLASAADRFPGFEGWAVEPDSLLLPWDRTFEIDFALLRPQER